MNQDMKKKWVEALRSGKYRQSTHKYYLKYDGDYSCLGVLCEISGVGYWKKNEHYIENDIRYKLLYDIRDYASDASKTIYNFEYYHHDYEDKFGKQKSRDSSGIPTRMCFMYEIDREGDIRNFPFEVKDNIFPELRRYNDMSFSQLADLIDYFF